MLSQLFLRQTMKEPLSVFVVVFLSLDISIFYQKQAEKSAKWMKQTSSSALLWSMVTSLAMAYRSRYVEMLAFSLSAVFPGIRFVELALFPSTFWCHALVTGHTPSTGPPPLHEWIFIAQIAQQLAPPGGRGG